jgi:ABC-2 type transport system ATP-binding protein
MTILVFYSTNTLETDKIMISLKDISFGYGKEPLFSGLNLSLEPGSVSGLLGKNGAGKTTLLKLMAGLLFPHRGDTIIMERNPSMRSPDYLQDLFFLPEVLWLPEVTPEQYAKLYAPFYPGFNDDAYKTYLNEFDLIADKNIKGYSYGQKKKSLLAFGLAAGCRFMLLDEPTNGLDIPSKTQFRKALASVVSDYSAIIISTHQVRDLENLIDPVIILEEGQIVFNHTMDEITDRLRVVHQADPPDPETALFSEQTLKGYMVVTENPDSEASNINLETLFNTVINSRERISMIFQGGGTK